MINIVCDFRLVKQRLIWRVGVFWNKENRASEIPTTLMNQSHTDLISMHCYENTTLIYNKQNSVIIGILFSRVKIFKLDFYHCFK